VAQAIKELADRLDGRPAQILEHSGPDSEPIEKIVREIVHVHETREEIEQEQEPLSPLAQPVLIAPLAIDFIAPARPEKKSVRAKKKALASS
jgi:hypothetical protein